MVEADITLCTSTAVRQDGLRSEKQFRLIHSILFDGSSLVTQDVIVLLIVSGWRAQAEVFQPFSWFLRLVEEPLRQELTTPD